MFNFNLMNRALKDAELKDAFRMLYYIVNKCSLKNSMSVEIFDAEFELALSISPRSTCRFTKKLEERGYIKKEVRGTSQNKLANIYTLIDIDTKDDKNVTLTDNANIDGSSDGRIDTLKNNNKINKNNKLFLSNTTGIYTGTNIDTGYNTTEEINNIKPEVIKHEVNNETYINSDENKNINTETNVITENDNNINIDNSNSNTLKNLNNMKETNNDTNVNNATLSEILEKQALDNYEAFDSSNVVVCNASSIETVNKYPQEQQECYQRLYTKTYDLIKEWYRSHDSVISSRIESNIRVINMMYEYGYISRKQLEASENNLKNYFNKLMDGWLQIIKERHTSFSNKDPQPPRQQNDQMEEVV